MSFALLVAASAALNAAVAYRMPMLAVAAGLIFALAIARLPS